MEPHDPSGRTNTPTEADAETTRSAASSTGEVSRVIDKYHLLRKIGEGGMGEVWLAEQREPVRRRVALKVIKRGLDTRLFIARFEAERQALALMEHPAIAKVFDAGETPRGRPYLVMEYADGIPITEHCDERQLTTRQRLELFIEVCDAVQHAHQKAIIHRDLKPTNILVATQDGKPAPKVIDFGIAKALGQRLTERTMFTDLGLMVGTPAYVSPEQAEGRDVDTRADVYSLGVVLYQLLTGTLPFDPQELRSASHEEIRKKIREDDPPRPSSRISTLGEASREPAGNRRTDPSRLVVRLRGDLDWITMKALEKDRARRYGSAQELAADIRRHLRHEPVLATPPSTGYRVRKFVRRHTLGVVVSGAVVLMLAVLAAAMTIQAGRIASERDRANREAEAKGRVSEFLTELFEVSDPGEARGNSITARELLDRGAAKIEEELAEDPELQAELMDVMGGVYTSLGLYPESQPLLERALESRRRFLGPEHPKTLETLASLGILFKKQSRFAQAEAIYRELLELRQRTLGPDDSKTLSVMNNLGNVLKQQGRTEEATPLLEATLDGFRSLRGDDHLHTLIAANNLASAYHEQGRYGDAEPILREAVEGFGTQLGENHPHTLLTSMNLANLYERQGQHARAESLYEDTIERSRRVLGEDHPQTLLCVGNLINLYQVQGRHDEAEPLVIEAVEQNRRRLGDDHRDTLWSRSQLADVYAGKGLPRRAVELHVEILETRRRTLGDDHPDTLKSLHRVIELYRETGRATLARELAADLLSRRRAAATGPEATAAAMNEYAWLLLTCEPPNLRDPEQALGFAERACGLTERRNAEYLDTLALAYHGTGRTDRAAETEREAIALLPEGESPARAEYEQRLRDYEEGKR